MFHFAVIGVVAAAVNTFGPVLYGSPVPGGKHALDVYAPAGAHALPVIVFFHGGGLQEGDRRDYVRFGKELAGQGYAVVIPSYRLYPSVRVRGSVSDAASALAWTARHISHYGGSAQKIVLLGHSAGGYLAAVLVLDARNLLAVRLASTIVRGVFELSADYSNRDPDPAEPPTAIAIDHHIYGETAEERDRNSVYRYLHKTIPFEAVCESIDPGTQCIDRDHFAALMRGYRSPMKVFTEPRAAHDQLVVRAARRDDPLNKELRAFVASATGSAK